MGVGIGKVAILLNGPPRAGKDTAINALASSFGSDAEVFKFTRPIKELAHTTYGLKCAHDAFDAVEVKDSPMGEFGGLTPREAYIETSRRLKAERGEDAVRNLFVAAITGSHVQIILNPDAGDNDEAEAVANALGADRVLVIRIHRHGHDFSQDCRTWINSDKLRILDVVNETGERRFFESEVVALARAFVEEAAPSKAAYAA